MLAQRHFRAPLPIMLLSVVLAAGCTQAKTLHSPETLMASQIVATDTPETNGSTNTQDNPVLLAEFDYAPASRIIEVRYRLRNASQSSALAVFDRGDLHAIDIGRQKFGEVGVPKMIENGEDIELVHAVAPLPSPSPTAPPTPIAIQVEPGAELTGHFKFALKGITIPKRLRWCLGVMPFDAAFMDSPTASADGQIWRASFAVVDHQRMVCTQWYDVATAAFEP